MPALNVNITDPVFIGDFFGMVLAMPISLFLAYWISAVKNHKAVVFGALAAILLAFFIILGISSTLIFSKPPIATNGGSAFFGSVLFCSIMGLIGGIMTDVLIARRNAHHYRRSLAHKAHE